MIQKPVESSKKLSFLDFKNEVIKDYRIAVLSRECSLLGRREVLTGKAKFGIFGGGKEVPQLAMAKAFKKGDWRSGYYRDQTFMMAIGEYDPVHFFASLYAHADIKADSFSAGRQMNGHFATHSINEDGSWNGPDSFDNDLCSAILGTLEEHGADTSLFDCPYIADLSELMAAFAAQLKENDR